MSHRDDRPQARRPRASFLVACALFSLSAVYFEALSYPFLLDEIEWIAAVKETGLARIFEPNVGKFRPLTYLVYAAQFRLFATVPAGYYLVNILLHLANAILSYHLLKEASRCALSRQAALVAPLSSALIFFVAFSHYQAPLWIGTLPTLLSTGLCLGSALLFHRYARQAKPGLLVCALLLYALSLLAKEQGVLFFLVYPLVWRLAKGGGSPAAAVRATAIFAVTAILCAAVTLARMGAGGVQLDPYYRFGSHFGKNVGVALWQLIGELVGFSQSLGLPDATWLKRAGIFWLVAAMALLLLTPLPAFARRRFSPGQKEGKSAGLGAVAAFCLGGFAASFLPYSFFVTLDVPKYLFHPLYHYLYLPSLFFIFLVIASLAEVALNEGSRLRAGLFTLFLAGSLAVNAHATYRISQRIALLADFKRAVVETILRQSRKERVTRAYLVGFPPVFAATFFIGQELSLYMEHPPALETLSREAYEAARSQMPPGVLAIVFDQNRLRVAP